MTSRPDIHPAIANLSPDRLARGLYWEKSWNVVTGCSHVSPGCDNCWCEREAARMARHPNPKISGRFDNSILNIEGKWTGEVLLNYEALNLPLYTRKPTVFAVWTDLFHPGLDVEDIDKVFAVMALAPQHLFLVITKRPDVMLAYLTQHGGDSAHWADHFADIAYRVCGYSDNAESVVANAINGMLARGYNVGWPMRNVILMTTAENQPCADERMPHMMELAAMGWKTGVSVEPMLGPVDLDRIHESGESEHGMHWESWESCLTGKRFDIWADQETGGFPHLSWVVCGGESGPNSRPMHPAWVRNLRDQCQAAGVPYFFKQWGEWAETGFSYASLYGTDCKRNEIYISPCGETNTGLLTQPEKFPKSDPREVLKMRRVGKHAAGRLLDGQTHDAFPEVEG